MVDGILTWLGRVLRGRPEFRTVAEVQDVLERELRGEVTDIEWDEFICIPIADPDLDRIREAVPLGGSCTEDGRRLVEALLEEARKQALDS